MEYGKYENLFMFSHSNIINQGTTAISRLGEWCDLYKNCFQFISIEYIWLQHVSDERYQFETAVVEWWCCCEKIAFIFSSLHFLLCDGILLRQHVLQVNIIHFRQKKCSFQLTSGTTIASLTICSKIYRKVTIMCTKKWI